MRTLKIIVFSIFILCTQQTRANQNFDNEVLVKQMSVDQHVLSAIKSSIKLSFFYSLSDESKSNISDESLKRVDNLKIEREYDLKQIESTFPSYAKMDLVEKQEVMKKIIIETNSISTVFNCVIGIFLKGAGCVGIGAGTFALKKFCFCAALSAAADAAAVVASDGVAAPAALLAARAEATACLTNAANLGAGAATICAGALFDQLLKCE